MVFVNSAFTFLLVADNHRLFISWQAPFPPIQLAGKVESTALSSLICGIRVEIVFYNINEYCGRELIHGVDAGDTIFVHMFGAYFGLAASW